MLLLVSAVWSGVQQLLSYLSLHCSTLGSSSARLQQSNDIPWSLKDHLYDRSLQNISHTEWHGLVHYLNHSLAFYLAYLPSFCLVVFSCIYFSNFLSLS